VDRRGTQSYKWSGLPAVDSIPMCVADMDFQAPPAVSAAFRAQIEHGVYGYTRWPESLNGVIAAWTTRRYHWTIEESWIAENQGVVASLCTAIRALTQEGDRVIIQTPVYRPFYTSISNNQRVVLENPLILDHGRYSMDFDGLAWLAKDAKLMLLCNPHNPVGRTWTAEELRRVGQICLEHGILVISDDIHADFTWTPAYCPFASLHPDFAQNSVTCLSPSKTFNVAGLNASYEVIPNPTLRKNIAREKARSHSSHPNLFGLIAMEHAYTACDDWLDDLLRYLEESRAMLCEAFGPVASVELLESEGTYLAWLDCRRLGYSSTALADMLLDRANVRVLAGNAFGPDGEGFLRLNYATSHAMLKDALPA
jgi:cystathionine beta-lyase